MYSILDESEEDRQRRALAELVQRHGGSITVRDLMRCSKNYATSGLADEVLTDLVKAGGATGRR